MGPLATALERGTATELYRNTWARMAVIVIPGSRVLRLGVARFAANGADVRAEMSLLISWAEASDLVTRLRAFIETNRPRRVGDPLMMRDGRVGVIKEIGPDGRMLVHVPGVLSARQEAGAEARDDERERDERDGSDRDG